MKNEETKVEYAKPEVVDYGQLREVTEASALGHTTDVPYGTTTPDNHVFSTP
jgi:hypothetical protein